MEEQAQRQLHKGARSGRNFAAVFVLLTAAVIAGAVLNTALGSVPIAPGRIPEVLLRPKGGDADPDNIMIVNGGLETMNLLCQLFIGLSLYASLNSSTQSLSVR